MCFNNGDLQKVTMLAFLIQSLLVLYVSGLVLNIGF